MYPIKFVTLPVKKQLLTVRLALFPCGLGRVNFFPVLFILENSRLSFSPFFNTHFFP